MDQGYTKGLMRIKPKGFDTFEPMNPQMFMEINIKWTAMFKYGKRVILIESPSEIQIVVQQQMASKDKSI